MGPYAGKDKDVCYSGIVRRRVYTVGLTIGAPGPSFPSGQCGAWGLQEIRHKIPSDCSTQQQDPFRL